MHTLSARALNKRFLSGELSAKEIVSHFLNRIDTLDGQVGAFTKVFHQRALKQAEALDDKRARGLPLGKLAGIPIGVKDNIHIQGEITSCASHFLSNYTAPFSATVVTQIEKEDGILIGKTNLDEFAMGSSTEHSQSGKTRNPWNLQCVPGGSSGGSAAAVAARLVPLALGSDTGGSIRQPASLCGVTGFKPTYGRVSRYGLVAFGSSLDQIGPFAAHAEDAALLMEVLGVHCEKDSTSLPGSFSESPSSLSSSPSEWKVGVPYSLLEKLEEEPKSHFLHSLKVFEKMGCELIEADLSLDQYATAIYYTVATAEASTNLARFDGIRYGKRSEEARSLDEVYDLSRHDGFGQEVKRRILLGTFVLSSGYQDAFYKQAQRVRTRLIGQYQEAFQKCHIIATPVTPFTAWEFGAIKDPLQMYLSDLYTIPANLTGSPAISIPSGLDPQGKPYGMQLTGAQLSDQEVLQIAQAYEKCAELETFLPPLVQNEGAAS